MRQVPGCHEPKYILLDYCHIFHLGYGMDIGASSIILLCYLGHFGSHRKLDDRLEEAYRRYDQWCHDNCRTSGIDEFSKQSFGMGGPPGCKYGYIYDYPTLLGGLGGWVGWLAGWSDLDLVGRGWLGWTWLVGWLAAWLID